MRILGAVKKHALSAGRIGCVGDVTTLNIARGCAGQCVFCHSRCISGAPQAGELLLYFDLPQQLRSEIEQRRKSPPPPYVVFCTATDGFLGGASVLQVTRACLEILLNRDIGVSLSTRGMIPEDVLALLGRHAPHVRVTVPITSLSDDYTHAWEPGTAMPQQRLYLLQRLLQVGIKPRVRIEPLIPFVNDHTEQVREVISAVVGLGLTGATIGFMHLRPGVAEQLQREAPPDVQRLLLGMFSSEAELRLHRAAPGGREQAQFRHLPTKTRIGGLRRIQRIGREHGLQLSACHCQNPGIPAGRCPIAPPEIPTPRGQQGTMFE